MSGFIVFYLKIHFLILRILSHQISRHFHKASNLQAAAPYRASPKLENISAQYRGGSGRVTQAI